MLSSSTVLHTSRMHWRPSQWLDDQCVVIGCEVLLAARRVDQRCAERVRRSFGLRLAPRAGADWDVLAKWRCRVAGAAWYGRPRRRAVGVGLGASRTDYLSSLRRIR